MDKEVFFFFGSYAHPFYRDLVKNPPDGYKYVSSRSDALDKSNLRNRTDFRNFFVNNIALPSVSLLGIPKVVPLKNPPCSRVHSAQYLLSTKIPYVVDFEDVSVFTWYNHRLLKKSLTRNIILKQLKNDNCKHILPWTQAARDSLVNSIKLPLEVKDKIRTVYPSYSPHSRRVIKKPSKSINFLFIGKAFYEKGGIETIKAFIKLNDNYDVKLTIISKIPAEIKSKYSNVKNLNLLENVSQKTLENAYALADVFVMPTHFDTFGFVYLEAMSKQIPCIGTDNFSVPEIISHGETGLVVKNHCSRFDSKFRPVANFIGGDKSLINRCKSPPDWAVEDLYKAMEKLVLDTNLRSSMAKKSLKVIESGKFSVKRRKLVLKDVYDSVF